MIERQREIYMLLCMTGRSEEAEQYSAKCDRGCTCGHDGLIQSAGQQIRNPNPPADPKAKGANRTDGAT